MIHLHATSSKNNVENELSVQNYVDPQCFTPYPKIFFDHLKIAPERYTRSAAQSAGRPYARYQNV